MAKSRYTKNGEYTRNIPSLKTIGALKKAIAEIPDKVPLKSHFGNTAKLVWFNAGDRDEHIAFDEVDSWN